MTEQLTVMSIHSSLDPLIERHRLAPFSSGDDLVLGDKRAEGGYGYVSPTLSLNGASPRVALLVKVFKRECGSNATGVAAVISNLHAALRVTNPSLWVDELLAVPLVIATANIGQEERLAAVMLDLEAFGFKSDVLSDGMGYHASTTVGERIDLAFRYAELAVLLEKIHFVHADHNPVNVLINRTTVDLQLVDFDAGVVAQTGFERPLTAGHLDAYMPPEVKPAGTEDPNIDKYVQSAERWSIGMMIGKILLGACHPAFFLREVSTAAVQEYAAAGYRWPAIDTSSGLFRQGSAETYDALLEEVQGLPEALVELLADMFAAGLDGEQRPSADAWLAAIRAVRHPPEFLDLSVTPNYVLEGTEATVRWSTLQAETVECDELLGPLPPQGEASFVAGAFTQLTFRARNRWGTTPAFTPVQVLPLPRIETVRVPDFPGFAMRTEIPAPPWPFAEPRPIRSSRDQQSVRRMISDKFADLHARTRGRDVRKVRVQAPESAIAADRGPVAPPIDQFFRLPTSDIGRAAPQLPPIPDFFSMSLDPWSPYDSSPLDRDGLAT